MALTSYCKKCEKEVAPGEICPICGTRLGKTSAHSVWCVERVPVRDWMSWNAVMRILLPAGLAVLLLVILLEAMAGGISAVEKLLRSGLPAVLAFLLGTAILIVFLILLLQGRELADYVIDNRGVHETLYLPDPTPLKLLTRLKLSGISRIQAEKPAVLKLSQKEISWRDVARVQLWPEKCIVLIYAPSWWLRISVTCTPFTWEDTLGFIRNKLGRKKKVLLPPSLVVSAPPSSRSAAKARPRPEVPVPDESPVQLSEQLPFVDSSPSAEEPDQGAGQTEMEDASGIPQ